MISVLTFNTWLVPTHSLDDKFRRQAMVDAIAAANPDVICLQEVWRDSDKRFFVDALKARGYEFSFWRKARAFLWKGLLGNGLLILSRFPMKAVEAPVLDFATYSTPKEVFMRKGVIGVQIDLPDGQKARVFNTHLASVRYERESKKYHDADREILRGHFEAVANYIASFGKSDLLVAAGDFNAHHLWYDSQSGQFDTAKISRDRQLLKERCGLTDAYHELLGEGAPISFRPENAYVQAISGRGAPPEYLDYVYYKSSQWRPVKAALALDAIVARTQKPLSDHLGVMVYFDRA